MNSHNTKLLRTLYVSPIFVLFLLVNLEFYLERRHLNQHRQQAVEFYEYKVEALDTYLHEYEQEIDNVLNDYHSCSNEVLTSLMQLKYKRSSLTDIAIIEQQGRVCSNSKLIELDFEFDTLDKKLQFVKNDRGIALVKIDPDRGLAVFWVISYREVWSLSDFSRLDQITVEYDMNGQFLLGGNKEGYYLQAKNHNKSNPITFDSTLNNHQHPYPIKVRIYYNAPHSVQLHSLAIARVLVLTAFYVLACYLIWLRVTSKLGFQIRRGLDNAEFSAHFQPVVELTTNKWVGAEALIRWHRNGETYLFPNHFIPYAEKHGLSKEFSWVCARDSKNLLDALNTTESFFISINVSPSDLDAVYLSEILHQHQLHNQDSRLEIEITERDIAQCALGSVKSFVSELNQAGIKISLDDFGTGHSGLSYINSLHFDKIKIDRRYVTAINTDSVDAHILTTIIELAKKLDVELVAEGIETQEQCDWLVANGIRLGQGWLYSKAIPVNEFVEQYSTNS